MRLKVKLNSSYRISSDRVKKNPPSLSFGFDGYFPGDLLMLIFP
jgi:hypothetical protein